MIGLPLVRPVCLKAEVSDCSRAGEGWGKGCTDLVDTIVDLCEACRIIFKVNIDLIIAKALQHGLGI
jgi:hypothetical protein